MSSVKAELEQLRSLKLAGKEHKKLNNAAPMINPEEAKAALKESESKNKHKDKIEKSNAVGLDNEFFLKQGAKRKEDMNKKLESKRNLHEYNSSGKAPPTLAPTKEIAKATPAAVSTSSPAAAPPAAASVEEADSDDDVPELEDQADESSNPAGTTSAPQTQNRSEKKSRKMIQKLGMRPVSGIIRVTVKTGQNGLFVIENPDVYKSAAAKSSNPTYVVFGEAKSEDTSAKAAAAAAQRLQNLGAEGGMQEAMAAQGAASVEGVPDVKEEPAGAGEEAVDETGVEAKDVELVMNQASCSRSKAVKALRENDGDLVNAIMSLTT
mmetsp:Transcript_46287/g.68262  ORF Transcript_46287/g.68262 Transcript_46287/m.68262 type:complete len:323 (+) Transcript_46287:68-1036(+)|eukprot:CAMPEP_0195524020 /NCGR_PEP_ID=MMETSP0794_2-20130614/23625_1 /TAXON_ID=515487 /ORGANISM="Stephanopyxis turris, Strain CCMP 815" /LENGTH=322 /DNA_ID=CAMNT_0040654157 /DNA_START=68 /DNA_END=1036 /DNA_ORIENTATION=+